MESDSDSQSQSDRSKRRAPHAGCSFATERGVGWSQRLPVESIGHIAVYLLSYRPKRADRDWFALSWATEPSDRRPVGSRFLDFPRWAFPRRHFRRWGGRCVCGLRSAVLDISLLSRFLFIFFLAKVRRKTKLVRTVLAIKVSWPGWIG